MIAPRKPAPHVLHATDLKRGTLHSKDVLILGGGLQAATSPAGALLLLPDISNRCAEFRVIRDKNGYTSFFCVAGLRLIGWEQLTEKEGYIFSVWNHVDDAARCIDTVIQRWGGISRTLRIRGDEADA